MMNLEELNKLARKTSDPDEEDCCQVLAGEVVEDPLLEAQEEAENLEEDLTDALDYLEKMLLLLEQVQIAGGKISRVPKGMFDLMEEVADFLEQWEMGQSKD